MPYQKQELIARTVFDLGCLDTYHTRPMPEDWSKLRDINPLADARACMDFELPLAEFPRLRAQLASTTGSARGRVCFDRAGQLPVADVEVSAKPALVCQRCLGAVGWEVVSSGRVALVSDAAEAQQADPELETVLAPEHRLSVRDLIEEELLLGLPLIARHPEGECAAGEMPAAHDEEQKPFAQLGELWKAREK
jgi:uncharacterized protein